MKDQIIISKINGEFAVAIPLFRLLHSNLLDEDSKYVISFNTKKPMAYIIDTGRKYCEIHTADFIKDKVEWLGDL